MLKFPTHKIRFLEHVSDAQEEWNETSGFIAALAATAKKAYIPRIQCTLLGVGLASLGDKISPSHHKQLPGPQVLHRLVPPEQVEKQPQRLAARARQGGVALQDQAGVVMRDRDQPLVTGEIGEAQLRQ